MVTAARGVGMGETRRRGSFGRANFFFDQLEGSPSQWHQQNMNLKISSSTSTISS